MEQKKLKKLNKIVGPGNNYVAAAKKEVFGDVGIEGMSWTFRSNYCL